MSDKVSKKDSEASVGFIGNPNCGKTTLFNVYTGANLKVANWPGVTVEKKEGAMKYHSHVFKLVDLPGIYSLTSYTMEEKVSRRYILSDDVDVIIDIADASCLERNLYLTLQLIELGKPVILALNMMDIVEDRGMEIDLHRLPEMLGIPVIPVSARKKTGLDILMHAVAHHKGKKTSKDFEHHHANKHESKHRHSHHDEYVVVYSDEIEDKIDEIEERLQKKYGIKDNLRWLAIKLLEKDEEIEKEYPDFSDIIDRSYETDIINQKYDFIEEVIEETVVNRNEKAIFTDKIDKVLTNKFLGLPIFLVIMAMVFGLTFCVGDLLKDFFEVGLGACSEFVRNGLNSFNVNPFLISLIVDGIIAGVGGILTFLPNIFMLFLSLAILEDSGYMSRVAYVMDGIMSKIGLSGRAFIPMLLGFGCTVPAVMSSRALENMRDRRKTILVTPFMTCSAKIPVYVVFSEMFFGKYAPLVMFSLYFGGMLISIISALVMKFFEKSSDDDNALLIELPEYKRPNSRSIMLYVWEKIKDYLTKAGTTIVVASIVIWFVLNVGPNGMANNISDSFGSILGKVIAPILKPAGIGTWQVVLALISGIAAKELIVSSFGIIYGINNVNSAVGMKGLSAILLSAGFDKINALALLVFCLLYTPCIASVVTMKKEFKSSKWSIISIVYQLLLAWGLSTVVYQIGIRI